VTLAWVATWLPVRPGLGWTATGLLGVAVSDEVAWVALVRPMSTVGAAGSMTFGDNRRQVTFRVEVTGPTDLVLAPIAKNILDEELAPDRRSAHRDRRTRWPTCTWCMP
jgi:hypothetical protein